MSRLEVRGATRRYPGATALDEVSLCVEAGTRAAIVGPSGCGKTTLLRVVAGFERLDAGSVTLGGRVLADADAGTDLPAHRRGIGMVSQHGALFPHLTVAENVGFALARSRRDRGARVAALMDTVELDRALGTRRPDQLSGGQQQRVALARALALEPALMLLDEPFSALDTGLRESLRRSVGEVLRRAGVTAVLVTHDQGEALSFAERVAVMRAGRIVQTGAPEELYFRPIDAATALMLGDALVLPARLADGRAECALGRLRTASRGAAGTGEIMLRTEQLWLEPVGDDATEGAGEGCRGRVVEREFTGATCTADVALLAPGDGPATIRVRVARAELAEPGALVRVGVEGTAHVLEPDGSRASPHGRGG